MRITNKSISNNFLVDMQRNLQNLSKVQQQVSSMKNFSKPSDDPLNVERSMQMQTSLNATDQYYSNITSALSSMETTDTTLGQLGTVLTNVRTDLVKAGDAGYTQDERDKVNDEVKQYVAQFAQILNTNLGGEYIFGGTQGLSKPVTTTTDANGNVSIEYADAKGNVVDSIPEVVSSGFNIDNWSNKTIKFTMENPEDPSNPTEVNVNTLDTSDGKETVDDIVKDLNNKIQKSDLKDSVSVVKTNDGNIKFLAVNSSDDIKISTDISDMSKVNGKQLSNVDMANIGADKTIEVSQGVVLDYNATASSVMQYGENNNNAINDDNVKALMNRIQHHLAGQVLDMDSASDTYTEGAEKVVDSTGEVKYYKWKDDKDAATKELTGQDLTDIDAASKGLLKVRSQIGAKEKRMEALQDQNKSSKLNIQETLSETEDIDLTQKTIEYSTMITVYQACLQTAAKVMQPTLMNYLS
ncbi:MAG: flagellar hook-associated protein FlgL [Clostridium tyrobutyricum]|uniref:flagellar hook-associated protein FlgL n=1 Tax=Clostridium tyrobutyricum TaxID=1519 RepID=UPI00242F3AED|nr:flagellar hook-associated protein FlgL [Clostridium tyrobutyricum]MCH4199094.1 flagellar hook-associated protein FlgL [Clostridium tyrobutyricum]MCH4259666.1 flagellar hook-associated protein FlgL [Clostridium tyrobutyricum]MCI1240123.1 flagellar hook-associated protein FlgL [Clostridium tyrobutyricum]MCI1651621.1 flagellar hook-associated protein FlgL [Clostridium tyrobutyricum]MCI1938469.1 flagellar hook-associated protein FlgL [Clostridium tyrobutyricum]